MPNRYITFAPSFSIDASPDYAAGEAIHTGALELKGLPAKDNRLVNVVVRDSAGQAPALKLLFFSAAPATATITKNSAFAWGSSFGDLSSQVDVQASYYLTTDSKSIADLGDPGNVVEASDKGGSIWLVVVANGAYNAADAADLSIRLKFERSNP